MEVVIPWDNIVLTIVTAALSILVGWLLNAVRQQASEALRDKEDSCREQEALKAGVKALLRGEIMRQHHKAVAQGYATTDDKEVMERTYAAYHDLDGNGVAERLYTEMMSLPTIDNPRIGGTE